MMLTTHPKSLRHLLALTLLLSLIASTDSWAQTPGISGDWVLDKTRSQPAPPPTMERRLNLRIEPTQIVLEDAITGPQGLSHLVDTLVLGREVPFVLRGPGGFEAPGVRRATLGEGGKLEVRDSVLLDGPIGPYTRLSEQTWTVADGGSRLVVDVLRKFALFSTPIHIEYIRQ